MKLIIKESHTGIIRRYERIKEMFQDYLLVHNVTPLDTFDSFFQSLCWDIAVKLLDRSKMDQDSYVTLRNQIIRFIKNHFYGEYKEWWDRRKNRIYENTSMSEKNKKFLKNKLGVDFTNGIKQITSQEDIPRVFIDDSLSWVGLRKSLNFWGPMYLFELEGRKLLYQDRGEFEWFMDENGYDYVDDEIPEKLGISVLGLRFLDIINMYFEEEV